LVGKRSVGYLILWGLAYLVTMLLSQLGNAALHAVGILTMLFGVGTAVGSNLVLLVKQLTVKPQPAVVLPPAMPPAAPWQPPRPTAVPQRGAPRQPTDLPR
jgi:hypothetical protein